MPRLHERAWAVFCYLGALRVPVVALILPEWAFTVPSGLLVAGAAWGYGRKHSPFLLHHAREGFRWSLQSNLLLAALALVSKLFWHLHLWSDVALFDRVWHFGATIFRWAGILVSILTLFVMYKAARGDTGDALTVSR